MPELSRFFGIIIRMFSEPAGPHHRPHLHAYYQDQVGILGVDEIEWLAGNLPRKQARLVEAWAELHHAELLADWHRLQNGQLPVPVEPLR